MPGTNVILSRPYAVKLPTAPDVTCPLTSQYLKVLFMPTFTTPVSSGSTENPASVSNRIVFIFVKTLPIILLVSIVETVKEPPIIALAGIVCGG